VPAFVGTRCKTANIAFVCNTPFPSSDIFRMLPARKDILRSLLSSDMIIFHCFTYARHFLTCCSRYALSLSHTNTLCFTYARHMCTC
jgi:trehalose-6-phosphate synthase